MVGIGGHTGGSHLGRGSGRSVSAAAFAALVLLAPSSSFAFRSGGDLPDFDGQTHVAFATPEISVELFQDVAPGVDLALLETDLRQAAEAWATPGCTNVDISYAGTTDREAKPGDGHNTIEWVSDWKARGFPKDSPGLTDVQYVRNAGEKWTIAEADTYLNLGFDWTTGVPTDDRKRTLAVLTHELGHALGLLHPCEVDGSGGAPKCSQATAFASEEMYPIYSADQTALSDDDIAGVCFLYSPSCDDASCGADEKCADGICKPRCGDRACGVGTECKKDTCVPISKDCGASGCVGQACSEQADCAPREYCSDGICARGEQALGDVCSSAKQCFDGACVDGACAESCNSGASCASGASCNTETGACTDDLSPMGEKCQFSSDCRGGYCLAQAGHDPACSRSCDDGQPQCPSGWGCRTADDQPVCAPAPAADEGCSIAPPPSSCSAPYGLALTALTFACWRSTRRRRSRRSKP
jgi:hypothetical protein